jgi:hypothetical protein
MTTIQEHNAATGEVIVREMTPEEIAQAELDKLEVETLKADEAAKAAAKAELLVKLGITADEAKLLLA